MRTGLTLAIARRRLLRLACAILVAASAAGRAEAATYAQRADALVRAYVAEGRFSGTVLVAREGRPVFRKSYGLANREWDAPATEDTRYRIGSMTKQFTAVSILQLAEAGKLALDDPVSRYYPEAPPAWGAVTLRHLLTHTSGIVSHPSFHGPFAAQARQDWTPEQIVALTRDQPLAFTPGARFAYDNTGYDLLGLIVERVSGEPYAAYLRDHVFRPAGLTHTGFDVATEILPHRATGYSLVGDHVENAPYLSMSVLYAAGGLYSTVDDLLTWDLALHGGKVLAPTSLAEMFRDQGFHYGFGEFIDVDQGHRHWGHGGGLLGFASMLDHYPDDGLTVVVLSNLEQANATRIARVLALLYFDPALADRPSGSTTPGERAAYVGRYQLAPRLMAEVSQDQGRLFVQIGGQPSIELLREFGRTFFMTTLPFQVTFADGGPAGALVLHQGLQDTAARRLE